MPSVQYYMFLPVVLASRTLMGLTATGGLPAMLRAVDRIGRVAGPLTTLPRGVTALPGEMGHVPGMWLIPEGAPGSPVVVFLHGGAFVTPLSRPFQMIAAHLGLGSGFRVFAPSYRILPDHVYPAAHADCYAVHRDLAERGIPFALVGDSTGGVLALATLMRAREAGLPQPKACILLSPTVDFAPSKTPRTRDAFVHPRFFENGHAGYVRGNDTSIPDLAPVRHDLRELAPIKVLVGEREFLRADTDRLEAAAQAQGITIGVEIWPSMWHGWYVMSDRLPEGRRALERAAALIRDGMRAS